MIPFEKAQITDKSWVDACLAQDTHRGCEFNFTSFFVWGNVYNQRIAKLGDRLVANLCGRHGCSYIFPVGTGDLAPALQAMKEHAQSRGVPLRLVALSRAQTEFLEESFPGRFSVTAEPEHFDYCYTVEKLANLAGKKLHGKRNHIKRFEDAYPDWRFAPLSVEDLPACLELAQNWEMANQERVGVPTTPLASPESRAIQMTADHYLALGMVGGGIWAEDKLLAFTMASPMAGDTMDVHFEKAYGEIQGAYPIINREFARYVQANYPQIQYLNREDDMGLPGLRRAKESYYPDLMVEKFTAVAH